MQPIRNMTAPNPRPPYRPPSRTWDVPPGAPRMGPNSAFLSSPFSSRTTASRGPPLPCFGPAKRRCRRAQNVRPNTSDIRPGSDWTWLISGPVGNNMQKLVVQRPVRSTPDKSPLTSDCHLKALAVCRSGPSTCLRLQRPSVATGAGIPSQSCARVGCRRSGLANAARWLPPVTHLCRHLQVSSGAGGRAKLDTGQGLLLKSVLHGCPTLHGCPIGASW
jgi:hypothetical protein